MDLTIIALSACGCKWPDRTNRQGQHLFCGQQRKSGSPYCEAHDNRAHFTVICDDAMQPPKTIKVAWNSSAGYSYAAITLAPLPWTGRAPRAPKTYPRLARHTLSYSLPPPRSPRLSGIVHFGNGRTADYREEMKPREGEVPFQ